MPKPMAMFTIGNPTGTKTYTLPYFLFNRNSVGGRKTNKGKGTAEAWLILGVLVYNATETKLELLLQI